MTRRRSTNLAIPLFFDWSNFYLHHFHIYGTGYGSNAADTRHVTLHAFGFQQGERFCYVYNYFAQWQCDIRLEAVLPYDPTRFYSVCTGGKRPAPPEDCDSPWAYLEELDAHRFPSMEAILALADAAQVVLDAPAHVSIREAIGDLEAILEAMDRLDRYHQVQPSAWNRRHINAQLHKQTWTGDQAS